MNYIIAGPEICPKTKKFHLQGYIQLHPSPKQAGTVQNILGAPNCHIEVAKGTASDNKDYCTKTGKYADKDECKCLALDVFEWGEMRNHAVIGAPTTLRLVGEALVKGEDLKTIAAANPDVFLRHCNGMARLATFFGKERSKGAVVNSHVLFGVPGSGKTTAAWAIAAKYEAQGLTVYDKHKGGAWWDGYTGQDVVLWDDFGSADKWDPTDFTKMVQPGPCRVPIKGGFINILATVFIFTSMQDPATWFPGADEVVMSAIYRRINTTTEFKYPRPEVKQLRRDQLVVIQGGWQPGPGVLDMRLPMPQALALARGEKYHNHVDVAQPEMRL